MHDFCSILLQIDVFAAMTIERESSAMSEPNPIEI